MATALELNHIWKKLHRGKLNDCLRAAIPAFFKSMFGMGPSKDELPQKDFWALPDIDFKAEEGERLGFVGHHGTGKSTLLKILSQILAPNRGSTRVNGKLRALIEVGAGFHGDLTGRENTCQNGVIPGMSHSEVKRNFDSIIDFSGIEHFLGMPVKRCSSGMAARLGFAVAARLAPDLLSLGDSQFQKKSLGKMKEAANTGRTILFVSSNTLTVHQLCSRAILLDHGKMVADGNSNEIADQYLKSFKAQKRISIAGQTNRFASSQARGLNIKIGTSSEELDKKSHSNYTDSSAVQIKYRTAAAQKESVLMRGIHDSSENTISLFSPKTANQGFAPQTGRSCVEFHISHLYLVSRTSSLYAALGKKAEKLFDAIMDFAEIYVCASGDSSINFSCGHFHRSPFQFEWRPL